MGAQASESLRGILFIRFRYSGYEWEEAGLPVDRASFEETWVCVGDGGRKVQYSWATCQFHWSCYWMGNPGVTDSSHRHPSKSLEVMVAMLQDRRTCQQVPLPLGLGALSPVVPSQSPIVELALEATTQHPMLSVHIYLQLFTLCFLCIWCHDHDFISNTCASELLPVFSSRDLRLMTLCLSLHCIF